ncbi:Cell cycle checkpoint protein RAD17 [Bienertia sinuspersici]
MPKRSNTIVLSSDDDDFFIRNSNCSSSNSKFNRKNSKSVSNSKSRRTSSTKTTKKKARTSYSLSSSVDLLSNFDESKFLSGDLAEDFAGFKVSTGKGNATDSRKVEGAESWVDKYRPRSLDELAVHKKKQGPQSYVLLITGQAGIGKSATVHVVASYFGAEVCEWNTPTPTIWQEHIHQSNAGMRYTSKLDEFENFVERARKYGMLSSSLTELKQPMVLLIEDFPVAYGRIAQGRLCSSLQLLVKSVQVPTVILITDCSTADSADAGMRNWEELSLALETAGACKIAFNPITVNSIKKVLSRIYRQEKCSASCQQIDLIANASGGDIRHAIMTFQYACLRQEKKVLVSHERCSSDLEAKAQDNDQKDSGSILAFGRDQTLSLFHALGKFLHNKRDAECTLSQGEDGFYMKEGFTRLPLKMDTPEKVLCQAYGQARPVAEFLHENVLDFLSLDAIEDAWTVASYLSDADCLLSSVHRTMARNYEAENIIQSAAASVAARGVLFGNAHPSPSRWHAIRRPSLWQVEKSTRKNMHEMEKRRLDHCHSLGFPNVSAICTDYTPALKWLSCKPSSSFQHAEVNSILIQDDSMGNDELEQLTSQDQASEITDDDDIEEW